MEARSVKKAVQGQRTVDGAGVHLTRVLSNNTVYDFDPFLMLDSFDSTQPQDYTAGFPWHPHRGIETITYLLKGEIEHGDSLGHGGVIRDGQCQWMTAASGIIHQEMPKPCPHMLGVQLWLNLPAKEKMDDPAYFSIEAGEIGEKPVEGGSVRVISGEFEGVAGASPRHIPARLLDIYLQPSESLTVQTPPEDTAFAFLIEGELQFGTKAYPEKSAVLFTAGSSVTLTATPARPLRALLCNAAPLGEPVAWGGPIVMNTPEELSQAFAELEEGTFTRHTPANGAEGLGNI